MTTVSAQTDYESFLTSKRSTTAPVGFAVDPETLNPALFEFQRQITRWALRKGRAALFCGCVAGETQLQTAEGAIRIDELARRGKPVQVWALSDDGSAVLAWATPPFRKGRSDLYEYRLANGDAITVTPNHRFLTPDGWKFASEIGVGDFLAVCGVSLQESIPARGLSASSQDAQRWTQRDASSTDGCSDHCRRCDPLPQTAAASVRSCVPSQADAPEPARSNLRADGQGHRRASTLCHPGSGPLSTMDSVHQGSYMEAGARYLLEPLRGESSRSNTRLLLRSVEDSLQPRRVFGSQPSASGSGDDLYGSCGASFRSVVSVNYIRTDDYYDLHVPGYENYLANGVWNHNTGLGKTIMQLEWARAVHEHTGGDVLILAPLAVAQQTVREGAKFGIAVTHCRDGADVRPGLNVTNYDRLHRFDPSVFAGIVLDESSILKAYDGATRTLIIESFAATPYRLACTATPAPNDFVELGNHAEFLGVMSRVEMLSMYFVHDGGSTQDWRLKGHAEADFWRWVCSWAVMLTRPSDLGYEDGGFALPPLTVTQRTVESTEAPAGMLFAVEALTLIEQRAARRASLADRVAACAETVNASDEAWIVWCDLNDEGDALTRWIPGAIQVAGADSEDVKEARILDFIEGRARVMVSKASILGWGLNLQHCHNVAFVGLSHSWEAYYQAIRRCWRFGQTELVTCIVITSTAEGAVVANIERKERDAERMRGAMVAQMADLNRADLQATERAMDTYDAAVAHGKAWTAYRGDCVEVMRGLDADSVDFSVFSPPFASLYTYSNSPRDMGNCRTHAEFYAHFEYAIAEMYRVLKPGRLLSFHCMNLPTSKVRDGVIGISDFRGDLIRMFQAVGFIYHSEVVIWKDPVTAMQRTKALGLLYKQLKKDSCMSRQGIPDYLVTMRKPGLNPDPVMKDPDVFPVDLWQRYASPVWMDINASETLQRESAREEKDERHIAPLQLEVIRRAVALWTNPGDLVLSPFMGIGSEGYVALQEGRRFVGAELKASYFQQAVANVRRAEQASTRTDLFDWADAQQAAALGAAEGERQNGATP